jgi:hypothetical protein
VYYAPLSCLAKIFDFRSAFLAADRQKRHLGVLGFARRALKPPVMTPSLGKFEFARGACRVLEGALLSLLWVERHASKKQTALKALQGCQKSQFFKNSLLCRHLLVFTGIISRNPHPACLKNRHYGKE